MSSSAVNDKSEITDLMDHEKNEENIHEEHEEDHEEPSWLVRCCAPIRGGSLRGSTFAMASITFGGGCLAFPYAVALCGPIIGFIIFLICGGLSYYTLKILLDAGVKARMMDYNELIELSVGKKWVLFSDINNIIMCVGIIMSYQFTVYKFACQLLNHYFDIDTKDSMNKIILMSICLFFIQIPLSCLKNISTLQYASLIGTFSLVYSIFVVVVEAPFYFSNYIDSGKTIPLYEKISWDYLDTFSTFMFGFASHNGIFQVFTELKRPSIIRYYKVLDRSFIIEIVLYVSIAFGGYFSTFADTKDVFLERPDLPGFNDVFIQIAKISLFICLHCTMAINYNIMRMSFKSIIFGSKEISFLKDFSMVVFTYIVSNIAVFYISNVTQILGVIGGVCTIVLCFVNPILIHIKLSNKPKGSFSNVFAYSVMIFVSFFGCAATIKSLVFLFTQKSGGDN
jgi:amino acid permease